MAREAGRQWGREAGRPEMPLNYAPMLPLQLPWQSKTYLMATERLTPPELCQLHEDAGKNIYVYIYAHKQFTVEKLKACQHLLFCPAGWGSGHVILWHLPDLPSHLRGPDRVSQILTVNKFLHKSLAHVCHWQRIMPGPGQDRTCFPQQGCAGGWATKLSEAFVRAQQRWETANSRRLSQTTFLPSQSLFENFV